MKRIMLAGLLAASTARAESWSAEAALGVGTGTGQMRWDGPAASFGPADGAGDLHLRERLDARLLSLKGFYGPRLSDTIALGLRGDLTLFIGDANFPYTFVKGGLEVSAGPELVMRPTERDVVGRLAVGIGATSLAADVAFVAARDNVNIGTTFYGPVGRAFVGWSLSSRFDLGAELRAGYFLDHRTTYAPVALLIGLHMTDL